MIKVIVPCVPVIQLEELQEQNRRMEEGIADMMRRLEATKVRSIRPHTEHISLLYTFSFDGLILYQY